MDGWMEGWVDGWMDGRVDGWKDGWMEVEKLISRVGTLPAVAFFLF